MMYIGVDCCLLLCGFCGDEFCVVVFGVYWFVNFIIDLEFGDLVV